MNHLTRPRHLSSIVLLIALAVVLWGCGTAAGPKQPVRTADGYSEWTVADLKAGLKQKNFTLVNVHIPFEGQIAGTDAEIPFDQITQDLSRLPTDKSATIVLYCRSGRMSEIAAKALTQAGYTNVIHVRGGMLAWEEAGNKLLQD